MTFRRGARLDPRQVRDLRGRGGVAIGGGIGGVLLIALVLLLGGDPSQVPIDALVNRPIGAGQEGSLADECRTGEDANERDDCRVLGYVNSVQAYWTETLDGYRPAVTTFFDAPVSTGCGTATSSVGPFYCPTDTGVYIDLGFYQELESRLGAEGGPLAQAYVIAHEYGHHVQHLLGDLRPDRGAGPESTAVRMELQADCYAGAWAGNAVATGFLEPLTDEHIDQALDTAAAIGDDRIQERVQGQVTPETWTHGSSEQRQEWFRRGLETGDPGACDTFSIDI